MKGSSIMLLMQNEAQFLKEWAFLLFTNNLHKVLSPF